MKPSTVNKNALNIVDIGFKDRKMLLSESLITSKAYIKGKEK